MTVDPARVSTSAKNGAIIGGPVSLSGYGVYVLRYEPNVRFPLLFRYSDW